MCLSDTRAVNRSLAVTGLGVTSLRMPFYRWTLRFCSEFCSLGADIFSFSEASDSSDRQLLPRLHRTVLKGEPTLWQPGQGTCVNTLLVPE